MEIPLQAAASKGTLLQEPPPHVPDNTPSAISGLLAHLPQHLPCLPHRAHCVQINDTEGVRADRQHNSRGLSAAGALQQASRHGGLMVAVLWWIFQVLSAAYGTPAAQ